MYVLNAVGLFQTFKLPVCSPLLCLILLTRHTVNHTNINISSDYICSTSHDSLTSGPVFVFPCAAVNPRCQQCVVFPQLLKACSHRNPLCSASHSPHCSSLWQLPECLIESPCDHIGNVFNRVSKFMMSRSLLETPILMSSKGVLNILKPNGIQDFKAIMHVHLT